MEPNGAQRQNNLWPSSQARGEFVIRRPEQLRPHPSYVRHQLSVALSELSRLAQRGSSAFRQPISITQDGTLLEGYAQWQLARQQDCQDLMCVEYELSEYEALEWMVQNYRQPATLNDFCRILLALDLEPWLKHKARARQRTCGEQKASSNLTKAERLDVREEIADAAKVSVGNVSKVKNLIAFGHSDVLKALREGEISIHRAWTWLKTSPQGQQKALHTYLSERGLKKTIRKLVARHKFQAKLKPPDVGSIIRQLSTLEADLLDSIDVLIVKAPGKTLSISEDLLQTLNFGEMRSCATNNH